MAALGGRESLAILCNSRNSRFCRFNSRLGWQKFPVHSATGNGSQELDLACRFRGRAAILWRESTKIPLQREKARIRPRRSSRRSGQIGQADVVLGERGLRGPRPCEVLEFGPLDLLVEATALRKTVQEARHPPREALGLPHPGEGAVRVAVEARRRPRVVELGKGLRQVMESLAARLRPLAPVGGTIWAASPARNSRPDRIGSATKLRNGAMLLSIDGPAPMIATCVRMGGGFRAAVRRYPAGGARASRWPADRPSRCARRWPRHSHGRRSAATTAGQSW
jgi:hypothetical protein